MFLNLNIKSFTGEMYLTLSNIQTSKAKFSSDQECFVQIWAPLLTLTSLKKHRSENFEKIPWRALWRNVQLARLQDDAFKHLTLTQMFCGVTFQCCCFNNWSLKTKVFFFKKCLLALPESMDVLRREYYWRAFRNEDKLFESYVVIKELRILHF